MEKHGDFEIQITKREGKLMMRLPNQESEVLYSPNIKGVPVSPFPYLKEGESVYIAIKDKLD